MARVIDSGTSEQSGPRSPRPGKLQNTEEDVFDKEDLVRIARTPMPFGKYQGRTLIDLPEEYLLWFSRKSFPPGELGRLMQMTLAIRIEGLEGVVKPLKHSRNPNLDKIPGLPRA